jgi:murein DD-endopeptidase MepM/ murein hydrolase activator NlpD
LTVRLLFAGRGVALNISPLVMIVLLLGTMGGARLLWTELAARQSRQAEQVAELQRKNEQLQSLMLHKEKEREQMVRLAEARSEELWLELDSRDQELEKLWKLVGKKPDGQHHPPSQRKSLVGSRAGSPRRSTIEVKRRYQSLMSQIQTREKELATLGEAAQAYREEKIAQYRAQLANRTPSIWPADGYFTSPFGHRVHPVYGTGRFHSGCDIAGPVGTEIRATAAGTVITSGWMGGYGNTIEVDHGGGLTTLYGHCSELLVPVGTVVRKGQPVARMGSTGVSTGPHVHYEVRLGGETIDPSPYMKEKEAPRPVANL